MNDINIGDIVMLDVTYRGGTKVKVTRIGKRRLFATIEVVGDGHSWDVLMNRLSVIK